MGEGCRNGGSLGRRRRGGGWMVEASWEEAEWVGDIGAVA